MRSASVSLLGLALAACSGDTGSDASDIQGGVRATAYPAAALLDVSADGTSGDCSAAVVAPRVVLTAGHCIHGFDRWTVTAPYANAQVAESTSAETYDWNVPVDMPSPAQHDIGLVYLDTSIALDVYPVLVADPLPNGTRVRYIGRVDGGTVSDTDLFVGAEVKLRPGSEVGWPFTYATSRYAEHGDSGGPVVLSKSEVTVIAGVASGGSDEHDIELFARTDQVHAWLTERIAAHP